MHEASLFLKVLLLLVFLAICFIKDEGDEDPESSDQPPQEKDENGCPLRCPDYAPGCHICR